MGPHGQTNVLIADKHVLVDWLRTVLLDIVRLDARVDIHVAAARMLARQEPRWWVGLICGWADSGTSAHVGA